jgi:Domain of unknown function (DUF4375)
MGVRTPWNWMRSRTLMHGQSTTQVNQSSPNIEESPVNTGALEPRWQANWDQLCSRLNADGYPSLSDVEKAWFNTRSLIDFVNNGGAISYFYNSGADNWIDCRRALEALNAIDVRLLVERVAALFGENVPDDVETRNAIIESWDTDHARDAMLEEVDRKLFGRLDALEVALEVFLEKHDLIDQAGTRKSS